MRLLLFAHLFKLFDMFALVASHLFQHQYRVCLLLPNIFKAFDVLVRPSNLVLEHGNVLL